MGNSESQMNNDDKINVELDKNDYQEYLKYKQKLNYTKKIKQSQNRQVATKKNIEIKKKNPVFGINTSNKHQTGKMYNSNVRDNYNNNINTYRPRITTNMSQSRHNVNDFNQNLRDMRNERNMQYSSNYLQNENYEHIKNKQDFNVNQNNLNETRQVNTKQDNNYEQNDLKRELNKLALKDFDPFNILKSGGKLTLEQLKNKYRKLALIHHPDKGGDRDRFEILMSAYKNLNKLIEYKKQNKTHLELRNNYKREIEKEQKTKNVDLANIEKKFNINKFNNVYSKTRLSNAYDNGYGNMMEKSSKNRDDIDINNTIGKYTQKNFQKQFNLKKKQERKNYIVKYSKPKAVESKNLGYSELGQGNIDDYSDNIKNRYTDYKKAHTQNFLIDPDNIKYKKYKNIEQLKKDRKNISSLSKEELDDIMNDKMNSKKKEYERIERLKNNDQRIYRQYQKTNRLMLGSHN